jgi:hypothetical protein
VRPRRCAEGLSPVRHIPEGEIVYAGPQYVTALRKT